ncbi:MAG: hypothetical protein ACAI43_05500 [Phycisphaerae bacterium]|nr:hypothetical protein [Tepidisphaeraceae bacterium]
MSTVVVTPSHPDPPAAGVRPYRLWVGLLGPPLAWLFHLIACYAAVERARESWPWYVTLHVASAVFLATALACGLIAWVDWRRAGRGWPKSEEGGPIGRTRFLAVMGIMSGALFALIIANAWLALFMLDPMWD